MVQGINLPMCNPLILSTGVVGSSLVTWLKDGHGINEVEVRVYYIAIT